MFRTQVSLHREDVLGCERAQKGSLVVGKEQSGSWHQGAVAKAMGLRHERQDSGSRLWT